VVLADDALDRGDVKVLGRLDGRLRRRLLRSHRGSEEQENGHPDRADEAGRRDQRGECGKQAEHVNASG
jgi:hypothetical protein